MPRLLLPALLVVVLGTTALPADLSAAEPLHVRIDKLLAAAKVGPLARATTDEEFVRRIYLDLIGRIPSSSEARAFIADKDPVKRTKLIDRLLGGPQYVRHLTDAIHLMLMERRTNAADWLGFLRSSIEQNKPWNEIAADILANDGVDPKNRGQINYFTTRSVEPNLLTREVGRMFFGMDLQCAQCHNHPLIDDYLQSDYYGIYGFLNRTYLFQPDKKKPAVLAEKPTGAVTFKSVFTGEAGDTRPRLPGELEITEPVFKAGDEYKVKPDKKNKKLRPIPKYSRRTRLAELVRAGKNQAFRRNIVNRLWAHMMGRGLVHPPDLHHSSNPPSHPELLDLLADEFANMKFDIKAFLRELALTKTYQRAVSLPENLGAHAKQFAGQLAALNAEQKKYAAALAAVEVKAEAVGEQLSKANEELGKLAEPLKKANAAVSAAKKPHVVLMKLQNVARTALNGKQAIATPLAISLAKAEEALKLQSSDKTLADIVAKLKARSTAISSEVTALSQRATAADTAAQASAARLATAEKTVKSLTARQAEFTKQVAAAKKSRSELAALVSARTQEIAVISRRIETVEAFLEYAKRLKKANASQAAADKALQPTQPLLAQVAKTRDNLDVWDGKLADATNAEASAKAALAATMSNLKTKTPLVASLAEVGTKTAAVLKIAPADAELKKLAAAAKSKADKLKAEVVALTKTSVAQTNAITAAKQRTLAAQQDHAKVAKALTDLQKQAAPLLAKAKPLTTQADKDQESLAEAYQELTKHWSHHFVVGVLEPLSPEQMAWSVMQATGLLDRQVASSTSTVNKKKPLKPAEQKDAAKLAARAKEIDTAVYGKLKGNVGVFVNLFGASAGQPQFDFFATAEQALFFSNGGQIRGWLSPSGGSLTDRLNKLTDSGKLAEELYLSVLTRRPTNEEMADVSEYLSSRPKERMAAIQEMVWALLSSAEFRFQH